MSANGYETAVAEKYALHSETLRLLGEREEARRLAIELRDALQAMYDECSELSDINNIGTHENHNMRRARTALRKAILAGGWRR